MKPKKLATTDQEHTLNPFQVLMSVREDKLKMDAEYELRLREFIFNNITYCPCCVRTLYEEERQKVVESFQDGDAIPSEIEILESLIFSYPDRQGDQEKPEEIIH